MTKKVLVTEYIDPKGLELLKRSCVVIQPPDTSVESIKAAIQDADGVVVRWAPISREVIEAAPKLKVIGKHGVGTDNIDIAAATERKVVVSNTPEANSEGVAEGALTLMLVASRRILECNAFIKEGRWNGKETLTGHELYGKTLGIVGLGRIGRRLAHKCRAAFDMEVYAFDPCVSSDAMASIGIKKAESLAELMPIADFVSVHAPLMPKTRGMVGAQELSLMKPTAYLINTSRGPVVDEAALIEVLRNGKIAGAALDVFEKEPPAADNPLLSMKNVVALPHMAGVTHESTEKMALHAAADVLAVLNGDRPQHPLNPEVFKAS